MNKHLQTKKRLFVLFFVLSLGIGKVWAAFSFSAACPTGQTLYYNITDATNHYVAVVAPASNTTSGWNNFTKPTGALEIPATVVNGNVTYTVASIQTYAFYGCSDLTEVTIPEGITSIGGSAFWNCSGIETVHFNATNCTSMVTNSQYSVFNSGTTNNGQSAIKTITIGSNVTHIPDYAFRNAQQLHGLLNVPASVTSIGNYAFYNCVSLNFLNLTEGLVTIGDYAFYYCQVLEGRNQTPRGLYIPNSVTTVGNYAFYRCATLPLLSIGEGVNSIGGHAFWQCYAMQTVYFNAINCTSMDTDGSYSVFGKLHTDSSDYPRIVNLTIGSSVTRIPDYAFSECSRITGNLTLPNTLVYIGNYAFNWCSGYSGSLTIPNAVTYVGNHAFNYCSGFTSLVLGNSVATIGSYAFNYCSGFTSLVLGNSVATIGSYAFNECTGILGAVTVPNATTSIGDYAFYHCSSVSTLTLGTGVETIGDYAFWYCPALATVHFNPTNCTEMYTLKSSNNYSVFNVNDLSSTGSNIVTPIVTLTIGSNVTRIPDYAFRNSTNMTSTITIPNATTFVGQYSFYGAKSTELTVGTGVATIGGYAFWSCPNLATVHFNATNCTSMVTDSEYSVFNTTSNNAYSTPIVTLTIGDNVTRIPDYAFRGSTSMTSSVSIPDACTYLGSYSFANSSGHDIFTGNNVTVIKDHAFYESPGFDGTIALGGSVTTIESYAFYNCSGLNGGLSFPETLVAIGSYAFYSCNGLTGNLVFPDSLTSIGSSAFYDCHGFDGDLVIPNSVTTIGSSAFRYCTGFDGSLVLGAGLTVVNSYTFDGCNGFTGALILGVNIETIQNWSFQDCSGFTSIITTHTPAISAKSDSFNSMNFNIPCYIPYGELYNYQGKTGWNNFSNFVNQCLFLGYDDNLWSTADNWSTGFVPTSTDVVCINDASCQLDIDTQVRYLYVMNIAKTLTVNSGKSLVSTIGIGTLQPSQLVVEDGSSLYNPISNTYGTIKKNIAAYSSSSGWYTLSTPIHNGTATSFFSSGTYDLYYYDEPTHYWRNKKKTSNNFTKLQPAQGCLYAHSTAQTLVFSGQINASNKAFEVPITHDGGPLAGYNLIGNPYTHNLNISDVKINGVAQSNYYKIVNGSNLVAYTADTPIGPCESFMVTASAAGTLTFQPTRTENQDAYLRLSLWQDNANDAEPQEEDRAYLRMGRGDALNKITLGSAQSLLYFLSDDGCYAISNKQGDDSAELLCLEVTNSGSYTINAAQLNTNLEYVHLVDMQTGADIDLLATPSYRFEATPDDLAARFAVVFSPGVTMPQREMMRQLGRGFQLPSHGSTSDKNAYLDENCTIMVTASPTSGGNVTGGGTYQMGSQCTITATPATGYTFTKWTKNGTQVSTNATYTFTVTASASYVAVFTPISYTISASANPTEGGTVSGAGSYNYGTSCTLTATPAAGYSFVRWTENGSQVSTNANYTFTVTGNRTLVAQFQIRSYTVTATASPSNGGTVSGGGTYTHGQSCTLTAAPATGYTFTKWTKNGMQVSTNPSYTFTVTESASYVAVFTITSYTITATANPTASGTVTGGGTFNYGATCTLTATATTGYVFTNWTKDNTIVSTNPTYVFTVTESGSYTANFTACSCTITATANPPEAGVTTGGGIYSYGSSCTLSAYPNTNGYTFIKWTKDGVQVSSNSTYTFTVTESGNYVAEFSPKSYTITASALPTEGGTVTGEGSYFYGEQCTLTATPASGYIFTEWTLNGTQVSTSPVYTFTVTGSQAYVAHFAVGTYVITATANPTEGGTVTGAGNYGHGVNCTLTATSNSDYTFLDWTEDGIIVSTEATYTFTVTESRSLVANFNSSSGQHIQALATGWNWWSTYVELSGIDGLTMLEESLGSNGLQIVSQNYSIQNYYPSLGYNYWFGPLSSLQNENGYKVKTSTPCNATMIGNVANPSDHPITIVPNWNWIGYPSSLQQSPVSAMNGFTPSANDVIKNQSSTATYYENYGWFPEGFVLSPGQCYMYKSNASSTQTLTFVNGRSVEAMPEEHHQWQNDAHAYADNLSMIAVVKADGMELSGEHIELGAFVNGECRGSALLKYFEPTDRWYAMLTVTGTDGDAVEFGIIDKAKGEKTMGSDKGLTFTANSVVGSLDEPYTISFGGKERQMHLYPNPVEPNATFTLAVPEEESVKHLVVMNAMGEMVRFETGNIDLNRVQGLRVTGVYTIKVICRSGNTYIGKLVVR